MGKISKHGGPSVEPDAPIVITRAVLGGETPIAQDNSEAVAADQARAEEEAARIENEDNRPSPKKATGKK